eukprot:scaffold10084_cov139-Isochrysis_galbana.AAC.1
MRCGVRKPVASSRKVMHMRALLAMVCSLPPGDQMSKDRSPGARRSRHDRRQTPRTCPRPHRRRAFTQGTLRQGVSAPRCLSGLCRPARRPRKRGARQRAPPPC